MLLVKDTEGVIFDCFFFFDNYFAAIETFPAFKVEKMIKEGLEYHKATTFFALHSTIPFLVWLRARLGE